MKLTTIQELDPGRRVTVYAVVARVDPESETADEVRQAGVLGDRSGSVRFASWADTGPRRLEVGEGYRIGKAKTHRYAGEMTLTFDGKTGVTASESPELPEDWNPFIEHEVPPQWRVACEECGNPEIERLRMHSEISPRHVRRLPAGAIEGIDPEGETAVRCNNCGNVRQVDG